MGEKFIKITEEVYKEISARGELVGAYLLPEVRTHGIGLETDCCVALQESVIGCCSPEEQIFAMYLSQASFLHSMGFTTYWESAKAIKLNGTTYIFDFVIDITQNKTQKRRYFAINIDQSYATSDFMKFCENDVILINLTKQDIRQAIGGCFLYIQQIIENVFDI